MGLYAPCQPVNVPARRYAIVFLYDKYIVNSSSSSSSDCFSCWYGQLLSETIKVVVIDVDHWTSKDFMAHFSLYATIAMIAFIVLRVMCLQRTHPRLMR